MENFERQGTKEALIRSVNEVYKVINGEKNNLRSAINEILDDDIKSTLFTILKVNKLIK